MWQKSIELLHNGNYVKYNNPKSENIQTIFILDKPSHYGCDPDIYMFIKFANNFQIKKAYDELLPTAPFFATIRDELFLGIDLSIQKKSDLTRLENFLRESISGMPDNLMEELISKITSNPRALSDLEISFYQRLDALSEDDLNALDEEEQASLLNQANEVALSLQDYRKSNEANFFSNPLWDLSQKCKPHSILWRNALTKINRFSNYNSKAQEELANYLHQQLSECNASNESNNSAELKLLQNFLSCVMLMDKGCIPEYINIIAKSILGINSELIIGNFLESIVESNSQRREEDLQKHYPLIELSAHTLILCRNLKDKNKLLELENLRLQEQLSAITSNNLASSSDHQDQRADSVLFSDQLVANNSDPYLPPQQNDGLVGIEYPKPKI